VAYYPSLEEDVARAKEILERGKAALEEQLDASLLPQPDVRKRLLELQGGTIYGGDIFAAYKLLESFVDVIETAEARLSQALAQGDVVELPRLSALNLLDLVKEIEDHFANCM